MAALKNEQMEIEVDFSELEELIDRLLSSQIKTKKKLESVKHEVQGLGEHYGGRKRERERDR